MPLITSLEAIPTLSRPCSLTIGTFDGVHLGHQQILQRLRSLASPPDNVCVLTFSCHPSQLFSPQSCTPLIYPVTQKAQILLDWGVDLVLLLPFDRDFSELSYLDCLRFLKERLHFHWLILGEGATFGRGKQGDETHVQQAASSLGFTVEYLRKKTLHHQIISSQHIRLLIQKGCLQEASACLGRAYSLFAHPQQEKDHLFCPLSAICLPPERDYPIRVFSQKKIIPYLNNAYVVPQKGIYLLGSYPSLHQREIEIEFLSY